MKIIGITGGIGSGKTTFSNLLSKEYNIPVIDADTLARSVVSLNSEGLKEIVKAFSEDILFCDKTLNRSKLGGIVFKDRKKLEILNNIVHPLVKKEFLKEVENLKKEGHSYVIYDCPLLIEEDLISSVDITILVHSDLESRINRILLRDNITKEEASLKISSQMDLDDKISFCDIVVYNNGDIKNMLFSLNPVMEKITLE